MARQEYNLLRPFQRRPYRYSCGDRRCLICRGNRRLIDLLRSRDKYLSGKTVPALAIRRDSSE